MSDQTYSIVLLPGDGIGVEVSKPTSSRPRGAQTGAKFALEEFHAAENIFLSMARGK